MAKPRKSTKSAEAQTYKHTEAPLPLRPNVGTQAQCKKRKPEERYRYDTSLSSALNWHGQNHAREQGEALIAKIAELSAKLQTLTDDTEREHVDSDLERSAKALQALSRPFLNWAGKAERLSFDVPTLPLFVHEKMSTCAIFETLQSHKRPQAKTLFDLLARCR